MSRSVWKGPFVDVYLIKKAEVRKEFWKKRRNKDLV